MPENREALMVMHRMKVPVASADGTRQVIREMQPGEFLNRADWDRFPARSRRSMVNTGFVRDPLSVEIDPVRNRPVAMPSPGRTRTVLRAPRTMTKVVDGVLTEVHDPGGRDPIAERRAVRDAVQHYVPLAALIEASEPTPAVLRKRGRPKGSKNKPKE